MYNPKFERIYRENTKGFHAGYVPHPSDLKLFKDKEARRHLHTYNHEIKCLMVFIFHFVPGEILLLRLEAQEANGWPGRLLLIPFLIKFSLSLSLDGKIPST